jgi:Oligosaccharide biosynthesis protein Alg14 like.
MRNLRTKDRYNKRIQPIKTLIVLGSGGHTTEMIHLLGSIKNEEYFSPINYIVAETDTTSTRRLESLRKEISNMKSKDSHDSRQFALHCIHPAFLPPNALVYKIPRAREVGQSYLTSVLTTLYSILYTARLVLLTTQPDLLIINGPGTCLPVALWCFVARLLGISRGNIVFIESFCRVKSLSLTGKVLWKMGIVDLFVVHWPELLKNVGKEGHQDEMVLLDSFLRHDLKKKEAEM